MSKFRGFSVVLALLFLCSTAWAAPLDRPADPLGSFLSSAPQGTAAAQAPLFLSTCPPVDCSEFDHYDCYYYWDWEANCCIAPDTPTGQICPFACF